MDEAGKSKDKIKNKEASDIIEKSKGSVKNKGSKTKFCQEMPYKDYSENILTNRKTTEKQEK